MGKSDLAAASLVACVDGPLQGQWFYEGDWLARLEAAAYARDDRGLPAQSCLGYRPADWTADPVQHPRLKTVTGVPLFYRDASRQQSLETAYPTQTKDFGHD